MFWSCRSHGKELCLSRLTPPRSSSRSERRRMISVKAAIADEHAAESDDTVLHCTVRDFVLETAVSGQSVGF